MLVAVAVPPDSDPLVPAVTENDCQLVKPGIAAPDEISHSYGVPCLTASVPADVPNEDVVLALKVTSRLSVQTVSIWRFATFTTPIASGSVRTDPEPSVKSTTGACEPVIVYESDGKVR